MARQNCITCPLQYFNILYHTFHCFSLLVLSLADRQDLDLGEVHSVVDVLRHLGRGVSNSNQFFFHSNQCYINVWGSYRSHRCVLFPFQVKCIGYYIANVCSHWCSLVKAISVPVNGDSAIHYNSTDWNLRLIGI